VLFTLWHFSGFGVRVFPHFSEKSGGGAGAGYPLVWCIPEQSFISVLVKSGFAARQISTTIHLHLVDNDCYLRYLM